MPSITRTILVALHATVLATLVGMSINMTPALGSPLPITAIKTNLAQRWTDNVTAPGLAKHAVDAYNDESGSSIPTKRQINSDALNNLNVLGGYVTQMNQNAQTTNALASQSSSQTTDSNFNQEYSAALEAFHTNFLGFQTTLAALAADKGLADYDKSDELETMMKDTVNAVKYILRDTDELVYSIPGLGPMLGPIVYDIKCIIDEVLDATENLTDAIINSLAPLLQALLGEATQTACDAGIQLAGLCVPV
ncbi:hypothetical protein WOLCODRAFT_160220 [Wolfiporia cocos MD-104 SS10]|uniref:Uncharacterized protein n=1 Tax=Wolfiporia cocos (strain MD-104) TaxID=742152 RepID=A0A2H3IV82_WOLCO|nr:hypothetical protein WOLCODRAFT_160220 [Wolfiporia cocos MD-104 SS10]